MLRRGPTDLRGATKYSYPCSELVWGCGKNPALGCREAEAPDVSVRIGIAKSLALSSTVEAGIDTDTEVCYLLGVIAYVE